MIPVTITVHKIDPAADAPLDALIFIPRDIQSLEYVASVSLDGDAVQADEFAAVLRSDDPGFLARWQGVTRSSIVILDGGERTEQYYFKELRRVGKDAYQLAAQSPIARLSADFPGDVYNAKPLPEVLAAVVGGVVPYDCNPLLGSVRVGGWAPYQSRRETIHALALAYGFLIRRNSTQELYFTVPDTDGDGYAIPDNNIFTGGSVAYSMGSTYYQAQITANDYRPDPDAAPQTLFENTGAAPAQGLLVKFDEPMLDVAADGNLTIDADERGNPKSGVNYAVVSGVGVLTGKPYAKYTSVVSVDGDPDADPAHILSVADAPLITSLNAASVGERLLSYANAEAVVSADITRTSQRPGDLVSFTDPFGDPRAGYIAALSGSVTTIDRANASIVCGYTPSWGAAYDAVEVLTADGVWTVPAYLDGKTVRVVLIGGGQGGASGQHGTDANGVGSGRGLPGGGGKIYEMKIVVSAGDEIPYSVGVGGVGGTYTDATEQEIQPSTKAYESEGLYHLKPHGSGTFLPTTVAAAVKKGLKPCETCLAAVTRYYVSNPGQPGTATTFFGDFSSDDGAASATGFYDVVDGGLYASPGLDNGADGGQATAATENGDRDAPAHTDAQRFVVALPWDAGQTWQSGAVGASMREAQPDGLVEWSFGGRGGGAAVGSDGSPGGNVRPMYCMRGGNGGDGASAVAMFPNPDARAYGCGGSGGHGGGEGGAGGSGHSSDPDKSIFPVADGTQGAGGAGSDGQDGKNGCILVYFKKPNDFNQFKFRVEPGTGEVILEYYTDEPPPFRTDDNHNLYYDYPEGETPPNFVRRGKQIYLITS